MKSLLWALVAATWLAAAVGVTAIIRWIVLHAECWLAGHDWPEMDSSEVQVEVECRGCSKRRVLTTSAPCASCPHDWWDHQEETPNGACAALPCGCRAYTPRSEP